MTSCAPTAAATPRASPFSTATPIRFPPGASSSRTAASSWCRTRRSRRFPRRRWTTSTLCRIRTPITRPTARRAACPPSPRCSSASSRTAAASRLLVLRADVPSGPHRPDAQPRFPAGRGGAHDAASRLQGLHPRRRRPTANFRQPACEKQLTHGACQNRQCLFPTPCRNLRADHTDYVNLLRELRASPA